MFQIFLICFFKESVAPNFDWILFQTLCSKVFCMAPDQSLLSWSGPCVSLI